MKIIAVLGTGSQVLVAENDNPQFDNPMETAFKVDLDNLEVLPCRILPMLKFMDWNKYSREEQSPNMERKAFTLIEKFRKENPTYQVFPY